MSFEMLWGEERKCSATVVGLDLVLALSKVRRCSLKRSFKRRLVYNLLCIGSCLKYLVFHFCPLFVANTLAKKKNRC